MAKKPKVSLNAIVEAFETQNSESVSYINVNNGDVVIVFEDFLISPNSDKVDAMMPECQKEEINRCQDIESGDDWIELPSQFEINEYQIMRTFADNRKDTNENQKLHAALTGSKAFRRFKDTAFDIGVIDEWYKFKTKALTDIARTWCEDNGFDIIEDDA
ncbi:MAG: hypothetical protein DWP95_08145 [Proteobacteria bacterium]|nr:MAG: hypothetical protein DWP95_08145 [Pseudomonadota bacterium]